MSKKWETIAKSKKTFLVKSKGSSDEFIYGASNGALKKHPVHLHFGDDWLKATCENKQDKRVFPRVGFNKEVVFAALAQKLVQGSEIEVSLSELIKPLLQVNNLSSEDLAKRELGANWVYNLPPISGKEFLENGWLFGVMEKDGRQGLVSSFGGKLSFFYFDDLVGCAPEIKSFLISLPKYAEKLTKPTT